MLDESCKLPGDVHVKSAEDEASQHNEAHCSTQERKQEYHKTGCKQRDSDENKQHQAQSL